MVSLLVRMLLLLLTSIPGLVSRNEIFSSGQPGVQTSPLELALDNRRLAFGKLSFDFEPELSNDICKDVYTFYGLFASALDIRTSTGEYLADDFTRKILTTANEVRELFLADSNNQVLHRILSFIESIGHNDLVKYELLPYFMTVRQYLAQLLKASTCRCTGRKCTFSYTIDNPPETCLHPGTLQNLTIVVQIRSA
ncbi:hypothetical protein HMI54_005283 [Coelomomyces lativittatus]|nr:hypothetical protein HMI54_005283 [Coelomomyces lativittatus]